MEFLFAEALILLNQLASEEHSPGTYPLSPELEEIPAQVWLELRGHVRDAGRHDGKPVDAMSVLDKAILKK